jgi:hypothetical protein
MSKGTKLKVFKAVGAGFATPHNNPSMFVVSAIYSAIMSTFMFFTVAFYQPHEAPDYISSLTGLLSLGEYLLFALVVIITSIFAFAMLSKMAFDSLEGKPDLSEALALSVRKFVPLLAAYILYYLIMLFGLILLIIPGIFLSIKLYYFQYFILFDNKGVIESLRLSWQMVKGNWWRTALLLLIWGILGFVSAFVGNLPRTAEVIIYFVIYLLFSPWSTSSIVNAYTQLKVKAESPSEPIEA